MAAGSPVSVEKNKNPLFIQGKCFNDCEAALIVGQEKTPLYVCMDQMARLCHYFRALFYGDFKEKYRKKFQIKDETTEDMVCFFNAIDPNPYVQKINGDSIELLMRLADKYQCDLLKERLKQYVEANEPICESAVTILNWFIWSKEYHMPKEVLDMCLPAMACLSLSVLIANREKIGLEMFDKLNEAKIELMIKAVDICNRNIASDLTCRVCKGRDRFPFKIIWCIIVECSDNHNTQTEILCSSCEGDFKYNKCCEQSDVFISVVFVKLIRPHIKTKTSVFATKRIIPNC